MRKFFQIVHYAHQNSHKTDDTTQPSALNEISQLKINFTNSFLRGGNDYKHISIVLCTNTNSIYVLISTNILQYLHASNLQNDTSGIRRVSESHEQFTGLSRYTLKMACESRGERDCYSVQILLIAMLVQLFNIGGSTFQYTYLSKRGQKKRERQRLLIQRHFYEEELQKSELS